MSQSELTPHDVDAIARRIRAQGLAVPVWFLIEATRPLAWLMGQAALMADPLVRALGLGAWSDSLAALLSDPRALATISRALVEEPPPSPTDPQAVPACEARPISSALAALPQAGKGQRE